MAKEKEFKSPELMLQWQWRSMIEELTELQRHLSDPSCPCILADSGEFCGPKHALGLHTLAKETIAMSPENAEMLEALAEEALDQHNALKDRIVCDNPHKDERDTVTWSRQWRKKLEDIYYHRACKIEHKVKVKDSGNEENTLPQTSSPRLVTAADVARLFDVEPQKARLAGQTEVEIGIADADKTKLETFKAIVDTGSTFVSLPLTIIKSLNLPFVRKQKLYQANNTTRIVDVYSGHINILGEGGIFDIVADEVPLIGALLLESIGFKVNPTTQQLEKTAPMQFGLMRDVVLNDVEPHVKISGTCSASTGCTVKVKGSVETTEQTTANNLPEAIDSVIKVMEKKTAKKATPDTYAALFDSDPVKADLKRSIHDELKASEAYLERSKNADPDTAALYLEIRKDELTHYDALTKRLARLKGTALNDNAMLKSDVVHGGERSLEVPLVCGRTEVEPHIRTAIENVIEADL